MNSITIKVGMIIKSNNTNNRYRIIYVENDYAMICQMDIPKLFVYQVSINDIIEKIINSEIVLIEEIFNVINYDCLKQQEKDKIEFINDFNNHFAPTYFDVCNKDQNKQIVNNLIEKHNISRNKYWRLVRRYLQSGLDLNSVINKKYTEYKKKNYDYKTKTGRPNKYGEKGILITEQMKEQFNEFVELYKSARCYSFQDVYDQLIKKYYSIRINNNGAVSLIAKPSCECPTYQQFYYYAHSVISPAEMKIIKSSIREFRNNHRPLESDSLCGILGPAYMVEMDAVELDVSLVSETDNTQCIGRPIVYVMIDVYTRVILALSVSLENNSFQGFTNCMINLAEDKVKYCNRFGVELTDKNLWPSNIYPKTIRVDRGADFKSKKVKELLSLHGIDLHLVPGGTGSLKGVVEQLFHQFNCAQNSILEHHGLITKRYDSEHHENSTLTLKEITKIMIYQVLAHNQLAMDSYKMTPEMIQEKVVPTPVNLWKFGCNKYGHPRPITNIYQYSYSLMTEITNAKLSRSGIILDELYYFNDNDMQLKNDILNLGNKSIKFECRMDVRDVGKLYYIRDNMLMTAVLNPLKTANTCYDGLTRKEYLEILAAKKKLINEAEQNNITVRINRHASIEKTVKAASKRKKGKSNTKGMRNNREDERGLWESQNTIMVRLDDTTLAADDNTYEDAVDNKDNYVADITAEEALEAFYAEEYHLF